jgi:hypothetical protein
MLKGVNWISVLLAVVLLEVLGYLWFGMVFNAAWMAEVQGLGLKPDMSSAAQTTSLIEGVVVTVVLVLGMAWLVGRLAANTLQSGMTAGFWAWLFFGLTTQALEYVYMGFTPTLMAINGGYLLLSFLIAGAVLGGVKFGGSAQAAAA